MNKIEQEQDERQPGDNDVSELMQILQEQEWYHKVRMPPSIKTMTNLKKSAQAKSNAYLQTNVSASGRPMTQTASGQRRNIKNMTQRVFNDADYQFFDPDTL